MTDGIDNLSATKIEQELQRVFTVARAEEISSSVISVVNRLRYAQLHLKEVRLHAETASRTGLMFSDDPDSQMNGPDDTDECLLQFHQSMFYLRKHVIECVQHLHAIGDTTAYALYHLVDLTKQLKPSKVYSHELLKYPERLGTFEASLRALVDSESFTYLSDFNNQAKHKGLARPMLLNLSEENDPMQRLFFGPITKRYEKSQRQGVRYIHPNTPIVQFLSNEIQRIAQIHNEFAHKVMDHISALPPRALSQDQNTA